MPLCANGHDSTWDDYCSTCGDAMGAAAPGGATAAPAGATAAPASGESSCSNCGEPHGPDDVFCENCGFDFASQTLPDAQATPVAPSGAVAVATVAVVSVDRDYYEHTIGGTELDFPDPVPSPVEVPLVGAKALVGRHSQSRGIFPEIDVAEITGDPAASSRHAMLEHDDDGNWTVDDLGSTNGTLVGAIDSDVISPGKLVACPPGTPIFIGAWTRIELRTDT